MRPERVIRWAAGAGRVEPDRWRLVGLPGADDQDLPLPAGAVAVPLARWRDARESLAQRGAPLGVWLDSHEDPATLAGSLDALALVAVRFPKLTDGRGYSIAALLRRRLGFQGELRAFGDIGRDQLAYLRRCGFDAFALPPHRDPEAALAGLVGFSVAYQGAVDDPRPLFRHRFPQVAP